MDIFNLNFTFTFFFPAWITVEADTKKNIRARHKGEMRGVELKFKNEVNHSGYDATLRFIYSGTKTKSST